jgi:thiol-disulfide isomerase/thioredoxin
MIALAFALGTVLTAPAELPALSPAGPAAILAEVRRAGAKAVLVNLWATWCQPCREEFPDLLRLRRDLSEAGLRVVLVSADFPEDADAAREFLAGQGVRFPSFIKEDGSDQAFIDGLEPRWSGALPATLIYDGVGRLRDSWEGKADYHQMRRRVGAVLEEKP